MAEPSAKRQKQGGFLTEPSGETASNRPWVTAMLTDLYHLTMAYAYWNSDRHKESA